MRALCSLFLPTPLCSNSVRICNTIPTGACNPGTVFTNHDVSLVCDRCQNIWPLQRQVSSLSYLDEHLAEEGHDEGGVHAAEAPDGADGQLSDLEHLVVQRHEQRLQVLRLGQREECAL
ncbi:hypothetical protein EYF80_047481 [Liparis tanakae]|uniref:Uncharacterized protein n=1 Tax=Liparis tanakae TaxID=230148 RepID=A0A4Z2FNC3_9TELE|nr:hypothetical protein EYF80_047481 [Liparis tanakae]